MAFQLSKTLIKPTSSSSSFLKLLLSQPRTFFSTKARLIELDLDDHLSSSSDGEVVMGLKMLEDAIHSIIARRLAPDWLPFRPGSSYWVPPKRHSHNNNYNLVDNIIANPLTVEQSLSLNSSCGWPSSSFFFSGSLSEPVIPAEIEVEVRFPELMSFMSEDED